MEPSVESGGTASWLSQPFEDFSCRDGEREERFREGEEERKNRGAWCLKWRMSGKKMEKRAKSRASGGMC